MARTVSEILRSKRIEIGEEWVAEMTATGNEAIRLGQSTLVDHLPELLVGLADWIDGDTKAAQQGFDALAVGHALTRLGHGIGLRSLASEYAILRSVLMRRIMRAGVDDPEGIIRLNEGMDRAVTDSVTRYTEAREATRETFISILGHDLRNPLSAISLAIRRLAELEVPETNRHVEIIGRSASRMNRMIGDLLDFARGRLGGGFPVNPRDDDMGDLCRTAIEELGAAAAGRTVKIETSGDLRGRWDRDRVVQALSNLLANAIEHGADPIRVLARSEGEHAVVTELSNMGAPLPEATLRTMFDPFGPRARSSTGLGLGLYIVHEVVLAHGGTVDVQSDPQSGTTFTIRWPRSLQYP